MIVIFISIFVKAHNALNPNPNGPCVGGPAMGSTGQPIGNGNYRFACVDGGSTVVHLGG
jgi:hypothetical protein